MPFLFILNNWKIIMIDLATATKTLLTTYLADEHGISLGSKATRNELVAKIEELEGSQGEGLIASAEEEGESRTLTHVMIEIHKGSTKEEQDDVNPICNGVGYQIQRGKKVKVPVIVYNVLKHAVRTVYNQEKIDGRTVNVPTRIARFPLTVIERFYK